MATTSIVRAMVVFVGGLFVSWDDRFGVPRPPLKVDAWDVGRSARSNSGLTKATGRRLRHLARQMDTPLLHGMARSVTFLWAMETKGTIRLCVEELAELPEGLDASGHPRRRGFPSHPA